MKKIFSFLLLAAMCQMASATTYYVSAAGGNRADGLSASTPKKDIQKVLDMCENGDVIRVAEGNYLGAMDAGYIEISKFVTLEGGYSPDFSERNPLKYLTKMEPGSACLGTNGNKGVITLSKMDNLDYKVLGTVKIDGFMINCGFENNYKPNDPSDPRNGCPNKEMETGRLLDNPQEQPQHQLFHSEGFVAGNIVVCNCMFANGPYFAIQMSSRCGHIEIYNNVFVSNRMGACRIDGGASTQVMLNNKKSKGTHYLTTVDFHHNTVCFSWCRDKEMGDMGYGYECMTKVNCDLHNNIFACNNYAAIARTHLLSGPLGETEIEKAKQTNVYDNCFFLNAADLQLPSNGGGKWTNVMTPQFEDVDESILPKYEGNKELTAEDSFVKALWQPYLKGFACLKVLESSSSVNRGSAANQVRSALGMNLQGSEILRVSMYGNRYKFEEALKLFGAKAGFGAQK